MTRRLLIWESDEDLSPRDWVEEIARDIWRDLLWAMPRLVRFAFWSGFWAWMLVQWLL